MQTRQITKACRRVSPHPAYVVLDVARYPAAVNIDFHCCTGNLRFVAHARISEFWVFGRGGFAKDEYLEK